MMGDGVNIAGRPNIGEREFETGMDETAKGAQMTTHQSFDITMMQLANNLVQQSNLTNQNAINQSNLANLMAIGNGQLAMDRQWNVDEQGYTAADILGVNTYKDALKAALIEAMANAFNEFKSTVTK